MDNGYVYRYVTFRDDLFNKGAIIDAIIATDAQILNSRKLCVFNEGSNIGSSLMAFYIRKEKIPIFEKLSGQKMTI